MRRIVITPAGRQRYLEILVRNLIRERNGFDEWHLWLNTNVAPDVEYCRDLARVHDWIKIVEIPGINKVSSSNIHKFFKHAQEKDAVYVRLDDDIVFIESGFFDKLLGYRLSHRNPFLVFANIINNAVITHIHQRNGLVDHPELCGYDCLDKLGWENGPFAEKVHRSFICDLESGRMSRWHSSFNRWICYFHERISINAVSWMGSDMASIKAEIDQEEEVYLTVDLPKKLGRLNEVFGGAIAAHFSFFTQREYMDGTDILAQYRLFAD